MGEQLDPLNFEWGARIQGYKNMNSNIQQDLLNSLAYGTIMRGDLPADIDEFNIVLVKETKMDSTVTLKLKFTPKKQFQYEPFFINIDKVRKPSNSIVLIKYGEKTERGQKESKPFAKADVRIKRKMILSVDRDCHQWEEIQDNGEDEENEDSDIPRRRIIDLNELYNEDSLEEKQESSARGGYKGRKRKQNSDDDEED